MSDISAKTKKSPWLPVVAGIIRKGDKVLLGRRPNDKNLPGLWEFAGGKIELNEKPEAALKRELEEELGIVAEIGTLKIATTHTYEHVSVIILFYEVLYWVGEPKTLYHTELNWFHVSELSGLDFPQANRNVLDRIIAFLK
jgi:8-oxo-dGTP diphosphatase